MEMTYEQKLMAIMAISKNANLTLREAGKWYCSAPGIDVKERHMLRGIGGYGQTVELAIEALWQELVTAIPEQNYIVARGNNRRAFRWNGFMWQEIDETEWAERWNWTPRTGNPIPDAEGGL